MTGLITGQASNIRTSQKFKMFTYHTYFREYRNLDITPPPLSLLINIETSSELACNSRCRGGGGGRATETLLLLLLR